MMAPTVCARPRRPLSAYNLFYRFKRAKIIELEKGGSYTSKEAICQLVTTAPGLEGYPQVIHGVISDEVRRTNIRSSLEGQLFSKDTKKRAHRKSSHDYKMTFVEMNKVMVDTWKITDEFSKSVFQELADEAKREYNQLLAQYGKYALRSMNLIPDESANVNKEKVAFNLPYKVALAFSSKSKSKFESSSEPLPFEENISVKVTQPMKLRISETLAFGTKASTSHCRRVSEITSSANPSVPTSLTFAPQSSASQCRRVSNVTAVETPLFPIQPLPFRMEEETSNAEMQSKIDGYKHDVSANDLMALLASLNES